jgi:hypothetical protein
VCCVCASRSHPDGSHIGTRPLRLRPGSPPARSPLSEVPAGRRASFSKVLRTQNRPQSFRGRMPDSLEGSLLQTRGRVVLRRPTPLWPPVRGSLPASYRQRFVVYRNPTARVKPICLRPPRLE